MHVPYRLSLSSLKGIRWHFSISTRVQGQEKDRMYVYGTTGKDSVVAGRHINYRSGQVWSSCGGAAAAHTPTHHTESSWSRLFWISPDSSRCVEKEHRMGRTPVEPSWTYIHMYSIVSTYIHTSRRLSMSVSVDVKTHAFGSRAIVL